MNCENKELFRNYYIVIPCCWPQRFSVHHWPKTKSTVEKFSVFISSLSSNSWSHQHFARLLSVSPSVSQSLPRSHFLFFSSDSDLEGIPPVFAQTHRTLCFFFSPFPSSVFISRLSQAAWGQTGAVLTLQAYWLRKREKILWTWFTMHEPHDTSFICTFFSTEKGADKPHGIFITLTSGMSVIRYTDKAN